MKMKSSKPSMDWFYTLFGRTFKLEVVRIIWDILLIFGGYYLLRLGFSVLREIKDDILGQHMHDGFNFIRAKTKTLEISHVLKNVFFDEKYINDDFFYFKVFQAQAKLENFDLEVDFSPTMKKF